MKITYALLAITLNSSLGYSQTMLNGTSSGSLGEVEIVKDKKEYTSYTNQNLFV